MLCSTSFWLEHFKVENYRFPHSPSFATIIIFPCASLLPRNELYIEVKILWLSWRVESGEGKRENYFSAISRLSESSRVYFTSFSVFFPPSHTKKLIYIHTCKNTCNSCITCSQENTKGECTVRKILEREREREREREGERYGT